MEVVLSHKLLTLSTLPILLTDQWSWSISVVDDGFNGMNHTPKTPATTRAPAMARITVTRCSCLLVNIILKFTLINNKFGLNIAVLSFVFILPASLWAAATGKQLLYLYDSLQSEEVEGHCDLFRVIHETQNACHNNWTKPQAWLLPPQADDFLLGNWKQKGKSNEVENL